MMSRPQYFKMLSGISKCMSNRHAHLVRRNPNLRMSTATSHRVVDLRSDTVTKPTATMRQTMMSAELGDDVLMEDPTVNELQKAFAEKVGKEAALFVPTCTMANTIAVLVQCDGRFSEVIVGNESHIHYYEVAAVAQFGGIQQRTVQNLADGTIDLQEIEKSIRVTNDDHQPWTKLICLENTHNRCGGKVIPNEFIKSVRQLADKSNVKLHMDGARLFNASAASGIPVSEIAAPAHTVSVAFSKGLCCPVGSMVAGSEDFIYFARRARKALGGGMRQAGVIAAPALYAIDKMADRLTEDHQRAKRIAQAIDSLQSNPVCHVDLKGVHTNIVLVDMIGDVTPQQFAERMSQVTEHERKSLGESVSALMFPFSGNSVRYVTHNDITDEDVEKMEMKFKYVIEEFAKQL